MNEYLVRGHLGGYYISSSDPEFIETYCETCGDYDEIEASWNSEEEGSKLDALEEFFSRESLKSKEELDERIKSIKEAQDDEYGNDEIMEYIIDGIFFDNGSSSEIIEYLYEDNDLSNEEYNELLKRNKKDLMKQLDIVKENLGNYLSEEKELKSTNKHLSMRLKQGF